MTDRQQCPQTGDHVEHYWRYQDESDSVEHYCNGKLAHNVDIYIRTFSNGN